MSDSKARERNRKYYASHREEIIARRTLQRSHWASVQPIIRKARDPDRGRRYYWTHRDEILAKKRHLLRTSAQRHQEHFKRAYGLTSDEYRALVESQGSRCALCGKMPVYKLRVDHNHATGGIRGLLCQKCNTGLGQFGDDGALLIRAAEYLDGGSFMELSY